MFAYVLDSDLRQELNARGLNYWDVYIQGINELLGVCGKCLSLADLDRSDALSDVTALVLGRQTAARLTDRMRRGLDDWVKQGGTLVGFGAAGLDHVFGIRTVSEVRPVPDDYALAGYFDLRPHPITHELHPFLFVEQKLLIVSDIALVDKDSAVELARLFEPGGKDTGRPAVTWHAYGNGLAGYFAFDVAKTVWLLHQGRPTSEIPENRYHPRPPDMTVIGQNSAKIPYADELCFLVQNMIAQRPQPFIYQIPPKEGKVADALLYWGGDEYVGPTELSLAASNWMREMGLPYHINIQENHPMTAEEFRHITETNGHEISLFYHTHAENGFKMTEDLYRRQSDEFARIRGVRPCTTVNSVTRWNHWAEPAKWMRAAGGKADNSFTSGPLHLEHPMANGPFFGFAFGTTYPFYFYDDARGGNRRIDYMEQPIVCYEIGHRGSLLDRETDVHREVHFPLEMAIKYHAVMNLFYHPVYIARYPQCRKAITEIVRYIRESGARVVHMGNDAIAHWWEARDRSTTGNLKEDGRVITFDCACEYPGGMVVKLLLKRALTEVTIDGRLPADYELRREFAGNWLFVVVPRGKHSLRIVTA